MTSQMTFGEILCLKLRVYVLTSRMDTYQEMKSSLYDYKEDFTHNLTINCIFYGSVFDVLFGSLDL